jgi:hypothetical protein
MIDQINNEMMKGLSLVVLNSSKTIDINRVQIEIKYRYLLILRSLKKTNISANRSAV